MMVIKINTNIAIHLFRVASKTQKWQDGWLSQQQPVNGTV